MRPDPEDESIVWMHTGDEGIIDKEGYLRSTRSLTGMPCTMLIRVYCSRGSNQGLFLACLRYTMNDVVLGYYHPWWRGELSLNDTWRGS